MFFLRLQEKWAKLVLSLAGHWINFHFFMFLFILSQKKSKKSFFPVAGVEQFLFTKKALKLYSRKNVTDAVVWFVA